MYISLRGFPEIAYIIPGQLETHSDNLRHPSHIICALHYFLHPREPRVAPRERMPEGSSQDRPASYPRSASRDNRIPRGVCENGEPQREAKQARRIAAKLSIEHFFRGRNRRRVLLGSVRMEQAEEHPEDDESARSVETTCDIECLLHLPAV